MFDVRPVLLALGILIAMLALGMLIPALVDLAAGDDNWQTFLAASLTTASLGGFLFFTNRGTGNRLTLRQAFSMTVLAWILLPAMAALPFAFSSLNLSYTDAFFEAMSGLTTTGSTVIVGLDSAAPGILIWRAILQWLGGIGIVVMAVAILPLLQIGGMQLFKMESSDTNEKILPRTAQLSFAIGSLYLILTLLCASLLMIAGMTPFDAIAHAMTTIATGGFSTSDGSVGHFDNAYVDLTIMIFMLLGSMPFVLYLQALRGRPLLLWRDEQVRAFAGIVLFLLLLVTVWLVGWNGFGLVEALRFGGFNVISILTGTGYATTDYGQWGHFSVSLFFLVMFIGGCAGSTSCGIKIFRFQVLFKSMAAWSNRVLVPSGVFVARYNGRRISEDVRVSILNFLIFFMVSFLVLAFAVALTGVDWITAFSGAGTALANVGPGLGPTIGPSGTFESLPSAAKWLLSVGMLMGRLELFTVLVMVTPSFWRG